MATKPLLYKVPGISNTADVIIPRFVTGYYSLQNAFILGLLFKLHNNPRRKAGWGLPSSFFSSDTKSSKASATCLRAPDSWVEPGAGLGHGTPAVKSLLCHYPCCSPWDVHSINRQEGKQGNYPMDCHHEYDFLQKEFLVFLEVLLELTINHRKGQLPQLR